MVEIPESLLRRSAEAKAKALGVPVEQVLAEMKGEGPPVEVPAPSAEAGDGDGSPGDVAAPDTEEVELGEDAPEPVEETPEDGEAEAPTPEVEADMDQEVAPEEPKEAVAAADATAPERAPEESPGAMVAEAGSVAVAELDTEEAADAAAAEDEPIPAVDIEDPGAASGNGSSGNGKVASVVSPRPSVPPAGLPDGVRTQRLLTVVKARAIQNVKAEPTDKVNTWPHLMLMEFGALLAIMGFLVILAVIIHSPLLEPANFNATPNPSKAPWYFLGLQELLSYFDPQIAGVMVPLFIGMIGFMTIPYVDKNPSTRPSDRKFAIMLYSIFLAGSATLTIIGVLFRGQGFNFSYPWEDGVFFDDLKDWVHFE
ncbi:MAG TPA: hypothetical protein VEB69_11395 [Acidimicrobiia bacterium]|nr:hypothetical protein [Acidimicrobiia bacterium]